MSRSPLLLFVNSYYFGFDFESFKFSTCPVCLICCGDSSFKFPIIHSMFIPNVDVVCASVVVFHSRYCLCFKSSMHSFRFVHSKYALVLAK